MPSAHPTVSSEPTPLYKPSSSPSSSTLPSFQPSPNPTNPPASTDVPTPFLDIIGDDPNNGSNDLNMGPPTSAPSVALDMGPPASALSSSVPTITSPPVGKSSLTTSRTPFGLSSESGSSPTGEEEKPSVDEDGVCLESTSDVTDSLIFEQESEHASACVDDADPYRTCLWQTTTVDKCDRMVKHEPFVGTDETLVEGTMIITLAQNPVATTCKNIVQMEKALMTFLADNIGSEDTYQPACVYTVNGARDMIQSDGQVIESTALEYKLSFVQKNKSSHHIFQRSRELAGCTDEDRALCCSQRAINGYIGEYCTSLACDVARCGKGRRPRKKRKNVSRGLQHKQRMRAAFTVERRAGKSVKGPTIEALEAEDAELDGVDKVEVVKTEGSKPYYLFGRPPPIDEPRIGDKPNVNACSFYGELTGFDFNDVVATYTEFKPEMTRSLLNVDDVDSAAVCSSNRYSIEVLGTPALTCDEYSDINCSENEDLASSEVIQEKAAAITVPLRAKGGVNSIEHDEQDVSSSVTLSEGEITKEEHESIGGIDVSSSESSTNEMREKGAEIHYDNLSRKEKILMSSGVSTKCTILPVILAVCGFVTLSTCM